MGRWADLETQVRAAVGDTSSADARLWLLEAATRLNASAQFLVGHVTVGTTTAGTDVYAMGTFSDLIAVRVGTTPYDRITPDEMWSIEAGSSYTVQPPYGGVWSVKRGPTGGLSVQIRPTPDESGLTIQGRELIPIAAPGDWAVDDPTFPVEFNAAIRHGAISIGLALNDESLSDAEWHEQRFLAATDELRRHTNSGPIRLRLGNIGR